MQIYARARRAASLAAFSALLALSERDARGQGNYRSAPLGGRSALMGGTGIARARDGAAPFLNPATIAHVDDSGFAFSANFLQFRSTSAPQFHRPGAVDQAAFGDLELDKTRLTTTEVDLVPSTLCFFVNLSGKTEDNAPRHRASLCFGTLERDVQSRLAIGYRGGSSATRVDQGQSFLHKWSRFSVGPAYSVNVTEELAVGASLTALAANFDDLSSGNTSIYAANGRYLATALDNVASGSSVDVNATLGVTYRIDSHYQVGLAATVPSLHILGSFSALYQTQYSGSDDYASSRRGEGGFRASTPAKIGAGISANLPGTSLELDASLHFPRERSTETKLSTSSFDTRTGASLTSDQTFATDTQAVVNTGLGVERFVRPWLGILAGVSTDFTSTPPRSAAFAPGEQTAFSFSRMNRASGSIGVATYSEGNEFVVGIEGSHGWGTTYALNPFELPNRYVPIAQSSWGFMLIVAGSSNLKALRASVEKVVTDGKK